MFIEEIEEFMNNIFIISLLFMVICIVIVLIDFIRK